jgi:hypothetical protein
MAGRSEVSVAVSKTSQVTSMPLADRRRYLHASKLPACCHASLVARPRAVRLPGPRLFCGTRLCKTAVSLTRMAKSPAWARWALR